MVARPKVGRKVVDTLAALRRDHSELVRAVARGGPGLADASGNEVRLDPDSNTPKVDFIGQDVSLTSTAEGVAVTDPTGTQTRDWHVRNLTVDGVVTVAGTLTVAGNILRTGAWIISQTPQGYPTLYSPDQQISLVGYNGQLYVADVANDAARAISASNVSAASEASMKDVTGAPARGRVSAVLDALGGLVRRFTWLDPEAPGADAGEHTGFVVDELADHPATAWLVTAANGYGIRSWHDRDVVALLVADRARMTEELEELRGRVGALEGRR